MRARGAGLLITARCGGIVRWGRRRRAHAFTRDVGSRDPGAVLL